MNPALHVTIVGGGFSGSSAAIQLLRRASAPLVVTVVEPRAALGPGLAYTTQDPDHRLNAPTSSHSVDPTDPQHFTRWCEAEGVFDADPAAWAGRGTAYVRRGDYGRYLTASARDPGALSPNAARIVHLQARATAAMRRDGAVVTSTDAGQTLTSALLIVATGNPPPGLPALLGHALREHPAIVADPMREGGVAGIDRQARVLVIGSGLTALDVVSTLVRRGHAGGIVVVSRRGLRPRPQSPALEAIAAAAAAGSATRPLDRILGPLPAFLQSDVDAPTATAWLRKLRRRIRDLEVEGHSWHVGFDQLRDVVWRAWPLLPGVQKQRFLRRLRPWYDVHRFRAPPQNDALVRAAEAEGRVRFRAARLRSIDPGDDPRTVSVRLSGAAGGPERVETFGAVVNCTGLDPAAGAPDNPFLSSLMQAGWLRVDDTGLGFAVDENCRAIDATGRPQADVRVIGPPTAGVFGDPLGAVYIAAQIHRMLPDVFSQLAGRAAAHRSELPL